MGAFVDITGKTFNRWTAIKASHKTPRRTIMWLCKCDCGNTGVVRHADLRNGQSKSCGCHRSEVTIKRNKMTGRRHGLTGTPAGKSWCAMMTRCYNPKELYFGRIKVCEFLKETPLNLLEMIGERPPNQSIDRIENLLHYSCGKCAECMKESWPMNIRWATQTQQGRNQRTNRIIEFNGERHCVTEWAEILGIHHSVIRNRIKRKVSVEKLLLPVRKNKRLVTIKGETHTASEWARRIGVSYGTLVSRVESGWSEDKIMTPPLPQYQRFKQVQRLR